MSKRRGKPTVVDAAREVLRRNKEPMKFKELIEKAFALLGKEPEGKLSHYHTEINMDRRFVSMGKGLWGLKEWVPKDQRKSIASASRLNENDYQPSAEDYIWDDERDDDYEDDESELLVPADEDEDLFADDELDLDELEIDSDDEEEEEDPPIGR